VGADLSAALVGGAVTALAEGAAPAGGCPATYTDPAGDAAPLDPAAAPLAGDDDLDIVAVTHSVDGGVFTTTVKVTDLYEDGPSYAFGDRFVASFTVAKKVVDVTAERDFSPIGEKVAYVEIDGTEATFPVKLVEDVKNHTIGASMAAADLEKAVGTPLAGAPFSAMSAVSRAIYPTNGTPNGGLLWDEATAPSTATYVFGTGCGAPVAAPAPAPSDAPTPAPSATPTATIGGSGDPSKPPTAGCFLAKDPKGDAQFLGEAPNDPDVDLTGVTLGSDSKNLYAYLKVDKLADGPAYHEGHRFYLNFTFNKHTFTAAGSSFKHEQAGQLKDGLAQTGQVAHVTQLAVDGVSSAADPERFTGNGPGFVESGLKFVFDQKSSTVQVVLPVADIEKYGKAKIAGAALSGVYVGSYGDAFAVAQQTDVLPDGVTEPAESKLTYAFGNNACFGASASPLQSVGVLKAQYGDTAAVAAKLVDAAGAPVAGQKVTFTLGTSKAVATTAANGVAKALLTVKEKAGKRTLVLTSGTTKGSAVFTVLVERTALKAVGSKGTVVATLTDDDRKPVAGQLLTFTSGSKKVTARTDAKGVAKAAGFAPGSAVKVAYAGAPGMYSAAASSASA
jgi:hypothetical protein